jgi:hypothetical protein
MTLQEAIEFSTLVESALIDAVATPDSDFKEIMLDTFGEVDEVEANIDTLTDIAAQFVGGALNQKDFRLLVQRTLQTPPIGRGEKKASVSRIVARFRAKTAAVLPQGQKQKVNMALMRKGMDGNKPWPRLGQALSEIGAILAANGISHDTMSSNYFRGKDGTARLDIDFINEADPFSPTPITNSMLVVTYHQFEETDRWEVVAYLS